MKSKTSLLLVLAALAATASTSHAVVYSIDDGTAGAFVGVTNGTLTFANGFTAVAGGEVIQSIEIAWGLVANGTSFTARLWSDPNGDGSPSDAVELLEQFRGPEDVGFLPLDLDRVIAGRHADAERRTNSAQVLVTRPEDREQSLRVDNRDSRAGHRSPRRIQPPTVSEEWGGNYSLIYSLPKSRSESTYLLKKRRLKAYSGRLQPSGS